MHYTFLSTCWPPLHMGIASSGCAASARLPFERRRALLGLVFSFISSQEPKQAPDVEMDTVGSTLPTSEKAGASEHKLSTSPSFQDVSAFLRLT